MSELSSPNAEHDTVRRQWIPYVTALVLFLLVLWLWWALENRENQARQQATDSEAHTVLNLIERDLSSRILSLQRFVYRWQQRGGMSEEEFNLDAASYLVDHPGYQALEWVDPQLHVRWVIPQQGNEQAIGLNLTLEANRRDALKTAQNRQEPTLSAPIELVQGGTGFLVYVPITVDGHFDGFLLAVFRCQSWINALLDNRDTTALYLSRIEMDQQEIYRPAQWQPDQSTVHSRLEHPFLDHHFTIYSYPTAKFIRTSHTPLPQLVLCFGLILSGCLVLIIYLFQKESSAIQRVTQHKLDLERQIDQRQRIEADREILLNDIGERVKALHCLYGLSRLAEATGKDIDQFLAEAVECLPPAWQHAEYASARILFDEHQFVTSDFQESDWKQEAAIQINAATRGYVQIFYSEHFPAIDEGPFSIEERYLINEIADRIGSVVQQKKAAEALVQERQRLAFILEGTHVGTWEWNVQTGETVFNSRWAEHLGYRLEELTPVSVETWKSLTHPDDLKKAYRALKRHFSGENQYYECELRLRHKQGHWIWILDRGKVSVWTEEGAPLMMFGTHMDITEKKQAESRIQHLANHDALTGLPSLRLARDRINVALESAHRQHKSFAVLFFDLDGFKEINDQFGHDAGDFLLQTTADRLLECVRKSDTVARIGGDEFILLLSEIKTPADVQAIAEKVIDAVQQPVEFEHHILRVKASIGIALYPDHGHTTKALIKQADIAMYAVKNSGKNGYRFADLPSVVTTSD